MADRQDDDAEKCYLSPQQEARIRLARQDLEEASNTDLADVDTTRLVLLVDRLRSALHDTVRLVDEITD